MQAGKGDLNGQRQRRRDRYRGCRICGVRGEQCTQCDAGEQLVALHGHGNLVLIVDGSFVPHDRGARRSPGWGGAGLVLVLGGVHGEVIAWESERGRKSSSPFRWDTVEITPLGLTYLNSIKAAQAAQKKRA